MTAPLCLAAALSLLVLVSAPPAAGKLIKGTGKGERITGTPKKDRILARGGRDRVRGMRAADALKGGRGSDRLNGGPGRDRLDGARGKDKLVGAAGKDRLRGGGGGDKLFGRGGRDRLAGNAGGDRLAAGGGRDRLRGGSGVDRLLGGRGRDLLNAVDGRADAAVDGGPGKDKCRVDAADVPRTSGCETLKVKGGNGDGGGGKGGAGGPPANAPLSISASRFSCPLPPALGIPALCTYSLAGTGADGPGGSVTGAGGVGVVSGSPRVGAGGIWSASGTATCTGDGALRVTIAGEFAEAPAGCQGLAGGGGGDGPLALDSALVDCTPPVALVPGQCVFALAGSGADAPTGTVSGTGGVSGVIGAPVAVEGAWTAAGAASCTADGGLRVTIGAESVDAAVSCG